MLTYFLVQLQLTCPIVVSAAIVQTQILREPERYGWMVFAALAAGLFGLNWFVEPHLSPIPRLEKMLAGVFSGISDFFQQSAHPRAVGGQQPDPDNGPRRLLHEPRGFSGLQPPSRALGARASAAEGLELGENPQHTLPNVPMPISTGQRRGTGTDEAGANDDAILRYA